jgi:transposase
MINRRHQLTKQVGALLEATCGHDSLAARLYLMDSKPLPLCHQLRHGRVRLMREDGARFGKTSKGWFFGFKLHALRHIAGRVMNIILTPANWDNRDPALALNDGTDGGSTIADLGYRGPDCAETLAAEAEMLLITHDDAPDRKFLLSQVRQGVETMFSQ